MTKLNGVLMAGLLFAATLTLITRDAGAATIDCSTSGLADVACQGTRTVVGQDVAIFAFAIADGGWYDLRLFDYEWPSEPLADLSLLLSTSTAAVGALETAGSLLFFAAPGQYFVQVYAAVGTLASAGLYGVTVQATVVPVPSAILLLASALAAFTLAARRGHGVDTPGPASA